MWGEENLLKYQKKKKTPVTNLIIPFLGGEGSASMGVGPAVAAAAAEVAAADGACSSAVCAARGNEPRITDAEAGRRGSSIASSSSGMAAVAAAGAGDLPAMALVCVCVPVYKWKGLI